MSQPFWREDYIALFHQSNILYINIKGLATGFLFQRIHPLPPTTRVLLKPCCPPRQEVIFFEAPWEPASFHPKLVAVRLSLFHRKYPMFLL